MWIIIGDLHQFIDHYLIPLDPWVTFIYGINKKFEANLPVSISNLNWDSVLTAVSYMAHTNDILVQSGLPSLFATPTELKIILIGIIIH